MSDHKKDLIENILIKLPKSIKNIFRDMENFKKPEKHIHLLFAINHHSKKTMTEYSEMLEVPKSHISKLSNKLIEEEFIERVSDENDRRIIYLQITEKGKKEIDKFNQKFRDHISEKLKIYGEEELIKANELFEELFIFLKKLK